MDYQVDTLAHQMGLHEIEIESRKSLFRFGPEDVANLESIKSLIYREVDAIVARFYEQQMANQDIALIIGDRETLRRLKIAQRSYLLSLVDGNIGLDYVNNRLRIGKVHMRIGVEPKHYMSSIKLLQSLIMDVVESAADIDNHAVRESLDKLLAFDVALVFETYTLSLTEAVRNEKRKVETYADGLERIVEKRTQELEALSLKDPLTGLPNRRALDEYAKRHLAAALRSRQMFSIIYMDVDGFKNLNDVLGHAVGDGVLRLIGDVLHSTMRASEIACRMGGDEFCLILLETDEEEARKLCERIITEFDAKHDVSVALSLSIGIHVWRGEAVEEFEELLRKADAAMYRAKKLPGNSIVGDALPDSATARRA